MDGVTPAPLETVKDTVAVAVAAAVVCTVVAGAGSGGGGCTSGVDATGPGVNGACVEGTDAEGDGADADVSVINTSAASGVTGVSAFGFPFSCMLGGTVVNPEPLCVSAASAAWCGDCQYMSKPQQCHYLTFESIHILHITHK